MGVYSWLDCITKEQIKNCSSRTVYLLIPKEFGGGSYSGTYDGYGHIGVFDVYDVVATFNREYLDPDKIIKPQKLESFGGFYDFDKKELREQGLSEDEINAKEMEKRRSSYEKHLKWCELRKRRISDFVKGIDALEMSETYGEDYLREIGIEIAGEDEDNERLTYPIKITYEPNAVYEECEFSMVDDYQGF